MPTLGTPFSVWEPCGHFGDPIPSLGTLWPVCGLHSQFQYHFPSLGTSFPVWRSHFYFGYPFSSFILGTVYPLWDPIPTLGTIWDLFFDLIIYFLIL